MSSLYLMEMNGKIREVATWILVFVLLLSFVIFTQAQDGVEPLTQTFTQWGDCTTIDYPEGWVARVEYYQFATTNNPHLLEENVLSQERKVMQSGDVLITLARTGIVDWFLEDAERRDLNGLVETILTQRTNNPVHGPTEFTMYGHQVIRVDFTEGPDERLDATLFVDLGNDEYHMSTVSAVSDDVDKYIPTAVAMLGSIAPVDLDTIDAETWLDKFTETYTPSSPAYGNIAFKYPKGWIAKEDDEVDVWLANVDINDFPLESCYIGIIIMSSDGPPRFDDELDIDEDATPTDIVNAMIDSFLLESEEGQFEGPVELTMDHVNGARISYIESDDEEEIHLSIALFTSDMYPLTAMFAVTAPGAAGHWDQLLLAIASTITYSD